MKKLSFLFGALFTAALFTACNETAGPEGDTDRVIIEEHEEAPNTNRNGDRVGDENEGDVTREDEGNDINFEVGSDEDGNVSGGVKGDIDLDDENTDNQ